MDIERCVAECVDNIFVEADGSTFLGREKKGWGWSATGILRFLFIYRKRVLIECKCAYLTSKIGGHTIGEI